MDKDLYGGTGWTKLWAKLEQQGNIGIDYCINPVLYPEICREINTTTAATVVDFGAGTNILAIQFLFGYQDNIPGLKRCKDLTHAREKIKHFIGIEQSPSLVNEAKKYHRDLGYPNSILIKQQNLVANNKLPFGNSTLELATSRNFLMHLNIKDLEFHMQEVARVLKPNSSYITAFLNPEYELRKYTELTGKVLKNNERYSFAHGSKGENGTFYHYFKTSKQYENLFTKLFHIESITPCPPITTEFRETHLRYYWKDCPMAYVYHLRAID